MKEFRINNYALSENSRVFIAAEIGLNHNGNINLAKKQVLKAKECGADAVKFQIYNTDAFINQKYAPEQYSLLKKYELSYNVFKQLKEFSDKLEIIFFATPFDLESANYLEKIKTPIIKIASGDLSNLQFLKRIAGFHIPVFLSTGLHTFNEIKESVRILERSNKKLVILYCISEYPLAYKNVNLKVIELYKKAFDHWVGFSDHSQGWLLDVMAVAMGAKVIEKHFTLDKGLPGPDHNMSLNPAEFKEMVRNIRNAEEAMGKREKKLSPMEKKIRPHALKGVYSQKQIKKGELFTINNLIIQRPLKGCGTREIISLIGRKAGKTYKKSDYIKKIID